MIGCQRCSTQRLQAQELTPRYGVPLSYPIKYKSIQEALQYLTMMCPEICYAVNQVCQFLHAFTTAHNRAVNRILCYLEGYLNHGIHFKPSHLHRLTIYMDANWAVCASTRRSTVRLCFSWDPISSPGAQRSNLLCLVQVPRLNIRLQQTLSQKCGGHIFFGTWVSLHIVSSLIP